MRIKLIKGVVVAGKARRSGDVVEADEKTALYLIGKEKAKPTKAKPTDEAGKEQDEKQED